MNAPPRRKPVAVELSPPGAIVSFVTQRRAGLIAIAVLAAAVACGFMLWDQVGPRVRSQGGYILQPESVELLGCPAWVRCDLKTEALRNASLDGGLPLDDPKLPMRLARAFDMHPWVQQVLSVKLRNPAGAVVEILCREPVAMVGVQGGLLAVSAEGIVLPSADFTAELAAEYPRISGVESSPLGPEGSPWGDPIVEEGAALAVAIGPQWQALEIVDCRPTMERGRRMWELSGLAGRVALFGSAPGREVAGEPLAAAKIARLKAIGATGQATPAVDLTQPDSGADGS